MTYQYDYTHEINIGNQVAENDGEALRNHFVPIVTSHFVGKPTTSIILGRKGAGKSALRLHFERQNQSYAVSVQPSSEDLRDIYEYIVQDTGSPFAVEPIESLWEAVVLLNLAALCRKQGDNISNLGVPQDIADDLNEGQRYGMGRTLRVYKTRLRLEKDRSALIRGLRDYIDTCLDGKKKYFVLIDSVDDLLHNDFDTTQRNDLFATFLESLLNFCRNFGNMERNKLASRIYLQVFIPSDLYNWSIDRHADHLRQYKHIVRWSFENLSEFAAGRLIDNIRPAQRPKGNKDVWRIFFPEAIPFTRYGLSGQHFSASVPIDQALIGMTLMRPRDLQEIIRQIDLQTKASGSAFPNNRDILFALQRYSIELRKSVISEYNTVFPKLGDLLGEFANNEASLPRQLLYDLTGKVVGHKEERIFSALKVLYEAGILGALDLRVTDDPLFSHTFEDFGPLHRSQNFVIHRAFWYALRIGSLNSQPGYR